MRQPLGRKLQRRLLARRARLGRANHGVFSASPQCWLARGCAVAWNSCSKAAPVPLNAHLSVVICLPSGASSAATRRQVLPHRESARPSSTATYRSCGSSGARTLRRRQAHPRPGRQRDRAGYERPARTGMEKGLHHGSSPMSSNRRAALLLVRLLSPIYATDADSVFGIEVGHPLSR